MTENILTEERYIRDITTFANSSRGDTPFGITAKQSAICRFDDHIINRQSQFQYNRKLVRLELWFMFYCRNGRPMRVREIAEILGTKPEENDAIVIELSTHPTLGIPYYKLYKNPEYSGDPMGGKVPDEENYVERWISAFGAEAGLVQNLQKMSTYSECNSSCNQSTTSTEDS
ncbi:Protein CBG00516 [Caenorhabditis briggsae]|uniref:Protein CBG00516 n=1 Tax=Caenorhabditis briggsae TaxID=6238 RepID=A8WNQ2_CAEBR|nr:Protein CBG00516 [Caenorhabditis briggsae]CAP22107.2 Protein CBG00516 [Caenorhabditis briggsae]